MARLLKAALPLVLLPAVLARGEDADPAKTVKALQGRVDAAIDKGVAYLLSKQGKDGSFVQSPPAAPFPYPQGQTALGLLALLKSGVEAKTPGIGQGFAFCREHDDRKTYSAAVMIMALEARAEAKAGKAAKRKARPDGGDMDWMRRLAAFLVENRTESPLCRAAAGKDGYDRPRRVWGYPEGPAKGWWDQSNIQYALLGLKAARRCGIEIPREVFWGPLEHLLLSQEKEGPEVPCDPDAGPEAFPRYGRRARARGWGYNGGRMQGYGSLTCAGLGGLLIARSELLENADYRKAWAQRTDQAIEDGFAWLAINFSASAHPQGIMAWHHYYLYGLERCGAMASVGRIGSHAWYPEGAAWLCDSQNADGSWSTKVPQKWVPAEDAVLQTCFALLFLSRATQAVEVPRYEVGETEPGPKGGGE